jgi:hypothetical protein
MRGYANRSADVAADLEASQTCSDRCCAAASAAAGRAHEVVRIVGCLIERAKTLPVAQHCRDVRFAEDGGARLPDARHDVRVRRCHVVLELLEVDRCLEARDVECLFNSHRDAVQRSAHDVACEILVARPRRCKRIAFVADHDGVKRRIVMCNPADVQLRELAGGDTAFADRPRVFGGRQKSSSRHWRPLSCEWPAGETTQNTSTVQTTVESPLRLHPG